MKVDNQYMSSIPASNNSKLYGVSEAGRQPTTARSTSRGGSADQVQFGAQADLVALAMNGGSSASGNRIAELQALVNSDSYNPDTKALSSKIVQSAIDKY